MNLLNFIFDAFYFDTLPFVSDKRIGFRVNQLLEICPVKGL